MVIGAGVAGLLSVITAKALGKRALLIEKHYMGGDCLNVGCVPSKCLVAAAKALQSCRKAASLGVVGAGDVSIDFPRVMKRMRDIRGGIAPHDGVARYGRDFCEAVIIGEAAFVSETEVVITARDGSGRKQTVAFDRCMVATGASAAVPPAPGLLETPHLTNGNFFNLEGAAAYTRLDRRGAHRPGDGPVVATLRLSSDGLRDGASIITARGRRRCTWWASVWRRTAWPFILVVECFRSKAGRWRTRRRGHNTK